MKNCEVYRGRININRMSRDRIFRVFSALGSNISRFTTTKCHNMGKRYTSVDFLSEFSL